MKTSTVLSSLFFAASTLALDYSNLRLLQRSYYGNDSVTTITATDIQTVTAVIPTTVTTCIEVPTQTVIVTDYEVTASNGDVVSTQSTVVKDITITSTVTVTSSAVTTVITPSADVQKAIDAAVDKGGVAVHDSTFVSQETKTLTVTQPIYITITPTASGTVSPVPRIVTSQELDTLTIIRQITKYVPRSSSVSPAFQNSTKSAIVSTVYVNELSTVTSTVEVPITSTVTNYVYITNSAKSTVGTSATVNTFVYNSVQTVTLTPTLTITKVVTLTPTIVVDVVTSTIPCVYLYTVTPNGVPEERTAVVTDTLTETITKTITVPAETTATPTVAPTSAQGNATTESYTWAKRHIHRRHALY